MRHCAPPTLMGWRQGSELQQRWGWEPARQQCDAASWCWESPPELFALCWSLAALRDSHHLVPTSGEQTSHRSSGNETPLLWLFSFLSSLQNIPSEVGLRSTKPHLPIVCPPVFVWENGKTWDKMVEKGHVAALPGKPACKCGEIPGKFI